MWSLFFGLQTLELKDFSKIFQIKGLKLKTKGHMNFYECCDLTKKVYLVVHIPATFVTYYQHYYKFHIQHLTDNSSDTSGTCHNFILNSQIRKKQRFVLALSSPIQLACVLISSVGARIHEWLFFQIRLYRKVCFKICINVITWHTYTAKVQEQFL